MFFPQSARTRGATWRTAPRNLRTGPKKHLGVAFQQEKQVHHAQQVLGRYVEWIHPSAGLPAKIRAIISSTLV